MTLLLLAACVPVEEKRACVPTTWFYDRDADGFGDPEAPGLGCKPESGAVSDATDCDDRDAAVHPGVAEACDGVDQDCDGVVDDEAAEAGTWYADADGDGFGAGGATRACAAPAGAVAEATDCDDADSAVHPGADEVCDGLDQDCDAAIDEDAVDATTGWVDGDGDGFGAGEPVRACDGLAPIAGDCDDADAGVNADAVEGCDGVDEDCDGVVDSHWTVPGAYASIQDAIDAAPDGALVCVGAGTWDERLSLRAPVDLRGAGSDLTVLDGGGQGPVVEVTGDGVAMTGLTITGGVGTSGAGLRARGDLVLDDVRITGNECASGSCLGVGMYVLGAEVTARGLVVDGNSLRCELEGQSCVAAGVYVSAGLLDVVDGEAFDNVAVVSGRVHGGALYVSEGAAVRWWGGEIRDNTVEGTGETSQAFGAAAGVSDGGRLELSNVWVADNASGGAYRCGGALFVHSEGDVSLTNVALTGNAASCATAVGGAVTVNDATVTLANCDVVGNSAGHGGAFFFDNANGTVLLSNTNVSGNAAERGGVVYLWLSPQLTASWTNFWDNGDEPFVGVSSLVGADGNLGVDPLHTDTSAAASIDWDLTLDAASPLIDAGDPGVSDVDGSRSDVGGYGGPNGGW